MSSTSINEKVQEALAEGHSYEDILAHLKQSDKPEYQNYLQGINKALNAPVGSTIATPSSVATPFLNMGQKFGEWAEQNPELAVPILAAPYVIKKGAQAISWWDERKRKQEAHELEKRNVAAYEQQVSRQNAPAAPSSNDIIQKTTQYELDPLQQERLREARAKADLAEARLQKMSGQSATPTTAPQGPPPPLKEAPLVESGLQNTFQNELNKQVESLQKAGAVPGSAAPNVAPTAVAPSSPKAISENFFDGVSDRGLYDMANNQQVSQEGRQAAQQELAKRQMFQGPESPFNQGPKTPEFVGPPESNIQGPPKPQAPPVVPQSNQPIAPKNTETTTTSKQGRKSKAEIEKMIAGAPEGMVPDITVNTKSKGAYHWLEGQVGPARAPAVWRDLVGDKTVGYDEFLKMFANYKLSVPDLEPNMGTKFPAARGFNEPRGGGSFEKSKYVPKDLKSIVGLLASGGLGYFGTTPEAQAAMQRASTSVQDIGISPNIFQGKGEELGRLGKAYVTAGNPAYRAELLTQMKSEKNPDRYKILMEEYQKAGGNVSGGVGIAPPPR